MKKSSMLPGITLGILLCIICFSVTLRGSSAAKDELSIPVLQKYAELSNNSNLNKSEKLVLISLLNEENIIDKQADGKAVESTYANYLSNYFRRSGINLSSTSAQKALRKIKDIENVTKVEGNRELSKMTIVGRGLVINLLEQLYEICGVKLVHNLKGEIVEVTESSGNYVYLSAKKMNQTDFRISDLIIILSAITTLFITCFMIAKKNRLFIRGEDFNECNEKGF